MEIKWPGWLGEHPGAAGYLPRYAGCQVSELGSSLGVPGGQRVRQEGSKEEERKTSFFAKESLGEAPSPRVSSEANCWRRPTSNPRRFSVVGERAIAEG